MAANRFATKLQRNTNKITLILIYAVLEWILIVLLLLNSLFSYLIVKFAEFFGLKPPCVWCTKIDHMFNSTNGGKNLQRDHLCENHAKEVSGLGFCQNHRKLVESRDMCEDCLSSRPEFHGSSRNLAFSPRIKEIGMVLVGEVSFNCSCCGVSLDSSKCSSYVLLKTSSLDVLECALKENLITEAGDCVDSVNHLSDFGFDICDDDKDFKDRNWIEFDGDLEENKKETEENGGCDSVTVIVGGEDETVDVVLEVEKKGTVLEEKSSLVMKDKSVQVCIEQDPPLQISPQHLEFFLDYGGRRLVPVELVDSMSEEHKTGENDEVGDGGKNKDKKFSPDSQVKVEEKEEVLVDSGRSRAEKLDDLLDIDINEEPKYAMLDSMEMEEDESSLIFHSKECCLVNNEEYEDFGVFPLARWHSQEASDVKEHSDASPAGCEEIAQANHENDADVSIGTEIPDLDISDELQIQDSVDLNEGIHKDPSTSCADVCIAEEDHCPVGGNGREEMVELQPLSVLEKEIETEDQTLYLNEVEEDKVPDTPTSLDSINQLHKKLLLLEKRDSGTEESLDGSITSELEGSDGVVTVERLKSALKAERKALKVLYAELEEERCASAVAANQTMAMINRLQEEKAAMQMEALQYQRMMDEQSEYDQEALQLLNELMVKREKEKQELEKELEGYRKKLFDYATKEKMRVLRMSKDGSTRSGCSSGSYSNAEDSDGLSIDLNQEAKEEEGFCGHQEYSNQNTPADAFLNLEESLADFEEERLSILEQLKVLEEKLSTLDDEEEKHFEDFKEIDDLNEDNVDEVVYCNDEANGHTNGLVNGKHHNQQRRIARPKGGKSLLPLFDAISEENGDLLPNGNGIGSNGILHHSNELKLEMENKKLAIEEEVDHLYERLQALEADRAFLKHCVSSLKKGDKGMDLLQEILHHLRDLRSVELRVRNLSDSTVI